MKNTKILTVILPVSIRDFSPLCGACVCVCLCVCKCVCVTNLLTNSSNPFLRSSIKSSSNRPTRNNIYTHARYERGRGCVRGGVMRRGGVMTGGGVTFISLVVSLMLCQEEEGQRSVEDNMMLQGLSNTWQHTLLSLSSSFLSHSKSRYRLRHEHSFSLNTGILVYSIEIIEKIIIVNLRGLVCHQLEICSQ